MRRVEWVDSQGRTRISLIRDDDPDEAAPQGIPVNYPDLSALDWEQIQVDLHNSLVSLGIEDWKTAQDKSDLLTGAILSAVRRPLLLHYRRLESTEE